MPFSLNSFPSSLSAAGNSPLALRVNNTQLDATITMDAAPDSPNQFKTNSSSKKDLNTKAQAIPAKTSTAQSSYLTESTAEPWQEWFAEHGRKLLLFARQQTRSEADAEDVLQEAIVRVWKGRSKRGQDLEFAPTLAEVYTSIRRASIDLGRKNSRRQAREQRSLQEQHNAGFTLFESSLEAQEQLQVLESALAKLPEKFSSVLVLKIWGDQTFAEIATTLEIPANTAASRYRYALEHLRRSLQEHKTALFDILPEA